MAQHPNTAISFPITQNRGRSIGSNLSSTSNRANLNNRLTPFSNSRGDNGRWHSPTSKSGLLHKGPPSEVTHNFYKTSNNNTINVNSRHNAVQTQRTKTRQKKHLSSDTAMGSLVEGRDKMAYVFSEAGDYSKITLSTLSIRVNKSSSKDLNLVGSDFQ